WLRVRPRAGTERAASAAVSGFGDSDPGCGLVHGAPAWDSTSAARQDLLVSEGRRPSDSPARSLARRFAGSLRSRRSLPLAAPVLPPPALRWPRLGLRTTRSAATADCRGRSVIAT